MLFSYLNKISLFSITISLLLTACGDSSIKGSGNIKRETRDVSGFSKIVVSSVIDLHVAQTGVESLVIEADDNILPLITGTVSGDTLTLDTKPNANFSNVTMNAKLTVKDLTSFHLKEVASATVANLKTSKLEVRTKGAGKATFSNLTIPNLEIRIGGATKATFSELVTSKLKVEVGNAGKVILSGTAEQQNIDIFGAGKYDALDLNSKQLKANVSGTGKALVNVTDKLDATVSGSGSVEYKGNPKISQSISDAGVLKRK